MQQENKFYKVVLNIAFPVTLQSILQSSFSLVDQVMTGQLGSTSIAGIGLGGKFSSLFTVMVSAVAAAAGIMIAQYMGKKDVRKVSRSFWANLLLAVLLAVIFTAICGIYPLQLMGAYTRDEMTRLAAADYLRILSASYIPMAVMMLLSTLLRCMDAAADPLYAGILAAVANTGLNYVLIFGKLGFPEMGVRGAALATVISQVTGCLITILLFYIRYTRQRIRLPFSIRFEQKARVQYLGILLPILACEFLWGMGENVYTAVYGHIGTDACAAMTLTAPVQLLFIGAMNGLAQAAGILIGKSLGSNDRERAYREAKKLMLYGAFGSLLLSGMLVLASGSYVQIYRVEAPVRLLAQRILYVYALVAPVKVQNMILGGGIIRSGGKTKYMMYIDFIGTWFLGVPLAVLAAFVWKLEIPYVYLILSLEECMRLAMSLVVFKFHKKGWMRNLSAADRSYNK